MSRARFVRDLLTSLARAGVSADRLTLTCADAEIRHAPGPALMGLRRLRQAGVHVGVTNFGDGGLTLGSLRHVPADVLVLAPELLHDCQRGDESRRLLGALIEAGIRMRRTVIAEGVTSQQELEFLSELNCSLAIMDEVSVTENPRGRRQGRDAHMGTAPSVSLA